MLVKKSDHLLLKGPFQSLWENLMKSFDVWLLSFGGNGQRQCSPPMTEPRFKGNLTNFIGKVDFKLHFKDMKSTIAQSCVSFHH